jgi:hypothetical protein
MREVQAAVYELTDAGVSVLSPADPRVVAQSGEFLFVASDKMRIVKLVQSRHLAAIASSDFLWLVAPDGYVGLSAAQEIGFALGKRVRVFTTTAPSDVTLREFVTVVKDVSAAVAWAKQSTRRQSELEALLDPAGAIDRAQAGLEALRGTLLGVGGTEEVEGWRKSAQELLAIDQLETKS